MANIKYAASMAALLAIVALAGCTRIIRKGPLIDRYRAAECISPIFGPGISPPTRSWDSAITTGKGVIVHIGGAEMPGGRIDVKFADGKEKVAADGGDYIYPDDVRFDRGSDRLYIKASGLAVLDGQQTWLFEYDLDRRRQTASARVDPQVVPQKCESQVSSN